MLNIRLHLVLVLVSLVPVASARASTLELTAPAPVSGVKTSSEWLRTGEAHQQNGENAEAGVAYRKALEALSSQKQGANEGARAAMLSADAHWQAFEQDLDVQHLQAALDVMSLWLTLTGPQSKASMRGDVERRLARTRAVLDPLGDAKTALSAGDVKKAVDLYGDGLDALADQDREWSVGARIVLRASEGFVLVYDGHVKAPKDINPHLHELRAARALLVGWKAKRPADDASEQGPAVEQALTDINARIAEEEQAVADEARAEQQRAAQRIAEEDARKEAERIADEKAAEREAEAAEARKKRKLAIGLLSGGVVAVGAGAGLLGEGLSYSRVSRDLEAQANDAADAIDDDPDMALDRPEFDAALADWRNNVDRRNLGFMVGGSVLAAGGLAMSIYGIVKLAQGRSRRGSNQRARIHPGPFLVTVEF